MTGEINRVPPGLLSLLDMKVSGQNPRLLSGELSASADILELYLQQGRTNAQAATNVINATGFYPAFTVPDAQYYWLHGFSYTPGVLAAGTTYKCVPAYRALNVAQYISVGQTQTYVAGERPNMTPIWFPKLLKPGAQLGVWCEAVTLGTAAQWIGLLDVTPIDV